MFQNVLTELKAGLNFNLIFIVESHIAEGCHNNHENEIDQEI